MHPKPVRQPDAQQTGNQPHTALRKHRGSQRPQTRASTMTTEYQERFLPPRCYTSVITTAKKRDPYHPLKATSGEVTIFKSFYVTHKVIKNQPVVPQPSVPPKGQRRCTSAPHQPERLEASQMASKVEDYTSVYKNDFQAWKATRRLPFKLSDSLKVKQGLAATSGASQEDHSQKSCAQVSAQSKAVQEVQEPFESMTSYRSDYVPHPVQPRVPKEKPVYRPNKNLTWEPAAPARPARPARPDAAWGTDKDFSDKVDEFFQQFKAFSLETKFQGQAKEFSPPADQDKFLSTTHADYKTHKCQRIKPILPSTHTHVKSKQPLQATTTMKEDYQAWDTPRRFPVICKEKLHSSKKTTFTACTHGPGESCKTTQKSPSISQKLNDSAACTSSCNATETPQRPAENGVFSGFEHVSNGNMESRRYWTSSLDRGVTSAAWYLEEAQAS